MWKVLSVHKADRNKWNKLFANIVFQIEPTMGDMFQVSVKEEDWPRVRNTLKTMKIGYNTSRKLRD